MKIIWLTDLHLNFLTSSHINRFWEQVSVNQPDTVLISGDISQADDIVPQLQLADRILGCRVYFVLGNHDFYRGSIKDVRAEIKELVSGSSNLKYLTLKGVFRLSAKVALLGHDSWADGRLGDYDRSGSMLNDYLLISDFSNLTKSERLHLMQSLAREAVDHFDCHLPKAFDTAYEVLLLTHVPPFREACLYEGKISDKMFLPHFSCKIVGNALVNIMKKRPNKKLTVFCGHTHGGGQIEILPNLQVFAGEAEYGVPEIQRIFEIE